MKSELLDALSDVDDDTTTFLLDALDSFLQQDEECDWENEVEPLLESFFFENPTKSSKVLAVLKSDPAGAVGKAKEALQQQGQQQPQAPPTPPRLMTLQKKHVEIPGAHNRAISLRQLLDIYDYVQAQAEADGSLPWIDRNELSPTNGMRMHVKTINLYHLVESVVKPMTKSNQCSMVEILANGPQKPQWVSSLIIQLSKGVFLV